MDRGQHRPVRVRTGPHRNRCGIFRIPGPLQPSLRCPHEATVVRTTARPAAASGCAPRSVGPPRVLLPMVLPGPARTRMPRRLVRRSRVVGSADQTVLDGSAGPRSHRSARTPRVPAQGGRSLESSGSSPHFRFRSRLYARAILQQAARRTGGQRHRRRSSFRARRLQHGRGDRNRWIPPHQG